MCIFMINTGCLWYLEEQMRFYEHFYGLRAPHLGAFLHPLGQMVNGLHRQLLRPTPTTQCNFLEIIKKKKKINKKKTIIKKIKK